MLSHVRLLACIFPKETDTLLSASGTVVARSATHTPTRSSMRTVRPTAKKIAAMEFNEDSSDSNRTPPTSISPRTKKERKAPKAKVPKPEGWY